MFRNRRVRTRLKLKHRVAELLPALQKRGDDTTRAVCGAQVPLPAPRVHEARRARLCRIVFVFVFSFVSVRVREPLLHDLLYDASEQRHRQELVFSFPTERPAPREQKRVQVPAAPVQQLAVLSRRGQDAIEQRRQAPRAVFSLFFVSQREMDRGGDGVRARFALQETQRLVLVASRGTHAAGVERRGGGLAKRQRANEQVSSFAEEPASRDAGTFFSSRVRTVVVVVVRHHRQLVQEQRRAARPRVHRAVRQVPALLGFRAPQRLARGQQASRGRRRRLREPRQVGVSPVIVQVVREEARLGLLAQVVDAASGAGHASRSRTRDEERRTGESPPGAATPRVVPSVTPSIVAQPFSSSWFFTTSRKRRFVATSTFDSRKASGDSGARSLAQPQKSHRIFRIFTPSAVSYEHVVCESWNRW